MLSGLLRDSLGFKGLVVTDALSMGAIVTKYGAGEAAVRALGGSVGGGVSREFAILHGAFLASDLSTYVTGTTIVVGTRPVATMNTPTAALTWKVGDAINFSGSATDAEAMAAFRSRLPELAIIDIGLGDEPEGGQLPVDVRRDSGGRMDHARRRGTPAGCVKEGEPVKLTAWVRLQWDRVAAGALVVTGLMAIVIGWFGATGTVYPAQQIPYVLSGGLAGMTLAGLGAALWVSADLKDEWLALRRLGRIGAPRIVNRRLERDKTGVKKQQDKRGRHPRIPDPPCAPRWFTP